MRTLQPTLEVVEDAILAALREDAILATRLRSPALDIQSFRGDGAEAIATAVQRQPALLVLYDGTRLEPQGMHQHVGMDTWVVLVLASNLRGEAARRRPAPAGEVGAYELVEHVLRVLTATDLGLDGFGELAPVQVELVETSTRAGQSLTLYQVAFEAEHVLRDTPPDQLLETLASTYEVRGADDEGETTWTEVVSGLATPNED